LSCPVENDLSNYRIFKQAGFLPWLLLGILPVFILYPVSFGGRVPFYMDNSMYFYPAYHFMVDSVRSGDLPFWNPYQFCGFPFLSDPQSQVFYPGSLLLYLLPFSLGLRLEFLLHYALAGIGMYGWLRILEIRRAASLSAAILFAWGGYMLPHMALIPLLFSAVWFPWVFWFLEMSVKKKNPAWALAAGLVLASSIYAGASQNAVYLVYGVILYGLWSWVPVDKNRLERPFYGLIMAVIALVSGLALAMAKLIPTWAFVQISDRAGGLSLQEASQGILTWKTLLPALLGGTGIPEDADSIAYIGISALILAAIGCYHHKRRIVWFALSGFILFIFISLGNNTPVYSFFFKFIPGFNISPAPKRILIYAALLIPLLSALGIEHLWNLSIDGSRKWIQVLITIFVVFLGVFSGILSSAFSVRYFGVTILILVIVVWGISNFRDQKMKHLIMIVPVLILADLIFMSVNYELQYVKVNQFYKNPDQVNSIRYLKEKIDSSNNLPPRIYSIDAISGEYSYTYENSYSVSALFPNMATYYGISDCQGYGIKVQDYTDFVRKVVNENRRPLQARYFIILSNPFSRFIRMLGVDYTLMVNRSGFNLNKNGMYERMFGENECTLWRLNDSLPRAFLVFNDLVPENKEEAFKIINSEDFDPGKTLLIEEPDDSLVTNNSLDQNKEQEGKVEIISFSPDIIKLKVRAESPAWLVLLEAHAPGWRARVNGMDTEVIRGNYWHRAMKVPEGDSEVELYYSPISVKSGLFVSLLSLVLWAVALIAVIRIKSKNKTGKIMNNE